MEMQGGSSIRAENLSGGGDGGNITLTVTGSFLMKSGAVISTSKWQLHRRGRRHSDQGRQ